MRYGFVLPGGTAAEQLEQAVLADQAGWDGVFVWEAAYGVDAWALLAAMAVRTTRVRLGTMLTPLPWRRPWKVAGQAVTLDQLSGGRAILSVGLGAVDAALGDTGEETGRRVRAERLDEGIDLIAGLWEGRRRFAGRHYRIDLEPRGDLDLVGTPVQRPRIPIWVAGAWPRPGPLRRAARFNGSTPLKLDPDGELVPLDPDDVHGLLEAVRGHRGSGAPFDVLVGGTTPEDPGAARDMLEPLAEAGCTWWLETRWELPYDSPERLRETRERLEAGPPRV